MSSRASPSCDCAYWYIAYSAYGKKFRENTKLKSERAARSLLHKRLAAVTNGEALPCDVGKVTLGELFELVRSDYVVNNLKSLDDAERRMKLHLAPFFYVITDQAGKFTGGMRAVDVGSDLLNRYVIARQQAHAMNGSINRELSILRRGFSLGLTATPPKVLRCPNFPRLKESPPRKGFLEDSQFHAITRACPELWFRAMVECARTFAGVPLN